MTAATREPGVRASAGPLFLSVTLPQPMKPHTTLSRIIDLPLQGCRSDGSSLVHASGSGSGTVPGTNTPSFT